MRYCPECRAEFDDPKVATCGSCECTLVEVLPPEVEAPMPEPPLAVLARAEVASAGIIAAELDARGIPCHLEPIFGLGFSAMAYERIIISKNDGPKAEAIMEELRKKHSNLKIDYTGQSENPVILDF